LFKGGILDKDLFDQRVSKPAAPGPGRCELFCLEKILQFVKELIIFPDRTDGCHRALVQDPAENKDPYGETDLPGPRHSRMPPDHGQRQRPHREDREDNKGCPEIPGDLFLCNARASGGFQKLAAVLALYRGVLNIFSAKGALFHCLSLGRTMRVTRRPLARRCGPASLESSVSFTSDSISIQSDMPRETAC
jgi:hypothetical protein